MTRPVATAEEAGGTVTVLQKRCRVEGEWGVLTGSSSGRWMSVDRRVTALGQRVWVDTDSRVSP